MDDLIEALTIFRKYSNEKWPTQCEHDVLIVGGVSEDDLDEKDTARLHELGFDWDDEYDGFASYRFGNA